MKRPTFGQLEEAMRSNESLGFCLACGEENDGVEPDARNYTCSACGERQVFGAEELMIKVALGAYTQTESED
jgi:hypothetical protein